MQTNNWRRALREWCVPCVSVNEPAEKLHLIAKKVNAKAGIGSVPLEQKQNSICKTMAWYLQAMMGRGYFGVKLKLQNVRVIGIHLQNWLEMIRKLAKTDMCIDMCFYLDASKYTKVHLKGYYIEITLRNRDIIIWNLISKDARILFAA